jgi:hypothetical protein
MRHRARHGAKQKPLFMLKDIKPRRIGPSPSVAFFWGEAYVDWPDLVLLPLGSTTIEGVDTDLCKAGSCANK